MAYKQHKNATIRMSINIFGNDVFLNLHDDHQHLIGHSPLGILTNLETTYMTGTQKCDDITAMDAKMRLPFLMDMMIETYFKNMTSYQYILASIGNCLDDAKMI